LARELKKGLLAPGGVMAFLEGGSLPGAPDYLSTEPSIVELQAGRDPGKDVTGRTGLLDAPGIAQPQDLRTIYDQQNEETQEALEKLTRGKSADEVLHTLEDLMNRIRGGDSLMLPSACGAMGALASVQGQQRRRSKRAPSLSTAAKTPETTDDTVISAAAAACADEEEHKVAMTPCDWIWTGVLAFISAALVIIVCIWSKEGLMASHEGGHHLAVNTRQGHMYSPVFATPATISLHGAASQFFEVRLVMAGLKDYSQHTSNHRRLDATAPAWLPATRRFRLLAQAVSNNTQVSGSLSYQLLADGHVFFTKTLALANEEQEHFEEVDVADLGKSGAKHFSIRVTTTRSDGQETAFLCQVLRMPSAGKYRQVIGIVLFVITFIGIVSELIHRSYSAFLGSAATLCTVGAIMETPHLHNITAMIDFGTLMLLFSMMILMRMLAVTGFFNYMSLKVVIWSRQDPRLLFFIMTNLCGWLSMVLDNVTCVLLFGPLTFSLGQKMKLNPRPLYLAMTICATIGGTATQIGDPPNIVIGSMTKVGFEKFLICNLPLVGLLLLPLSSGLLWYRLSDKLSLDSGEKVELDFTKLIKENQITDPPMFFKLMAVLSGVLLALILSPVHKIEPPWFTVMAMFGCAMLFERHHFASYLDFVEWDTLLFFALLFVLVEGLSELGVIRLLGDGVMAFIKAFPEDSRMAVAVITILWVSSIGSAFLESLPYTTVITYMILDLQAKNDVPGVDPFVLVWPLSVGACVGGIGSIMGSSANLVCMAVSNRYGKEESQKVQGSDFLKYGLPVLVVLTLIAMIWQLVLFVAAEYKP